MRDRPIKGREYEISCKARTPCLSLSSLLFSLRFSRSITVEETISLPVSLAASGPRGFRAPPCQWEMGKNREVFEASSPCRRHRLVSRESWQLPAPSPPPPLSLLAERRVGRILLPGPRPPPPTTPPPSSCGLQRRWGRGREKAGRAQAARWQVRWGGARSGR